MSGAIYNGGAIEAVASLEGVEKQAEATIYYLHCPACHRFLKHDTLRIRFTGGYQEWYGPTFEWIADCPAHGTINPDGDWEGGDFL